MKKILLILLSFLIISGCNLSSSFEKESDDPNLMFPGYKNSEVDLNAPIKFLFEDENWSRWYEVTIDGEKYIYIFNNHNGSVSITKK
jgi:hypothetical protein